MVGTACAITPTKIVKWQLPLQSRGLEITFCCEMLLIFLSLFFFPLNKSEYISGHDSDLRKCFLTSLWLVIEGLHCSPDIYGLLYPRKSYFKRLQELSASCFMYYLSVSYSFLYASDFIFFFQPLPLMLQNGRPAVICTGGCLQAGLCCPAPWAVGGSVSSSLGSPAFSTVIFQTSLLLFPCINFFFPFGISFSLGKLCCPSPRKSLVVCEEGPEWLWQQGKAAAASSLAGEQSRKAAPAPSSPGQ